MQLDTWHRHQQTRDGSLLMTPTPANHMNPLPANHAADQLLGGRGGSGGGAVGSSPLNPMLTPSPNADTRYYCNN
jgi:hypothetical protein